MKIEGQISIRFDKSGLTIEVYDKNSSITFLEASLNPEDSCAALGRLFMVPCVLDVKGLDKIGKKHENSTHEFEIPDRRIDKEVLYKLAVESCPDGWKPDNYFNSQNSFFQKDGKQFARCTIRRWV